MSTITIAVPDPLDAALVERMTAAGALSKEEYVLALVESDCAASELERTLAARSRGPFLCSFTWPAGRPHVGEVTSAPVRWSASSFEPMDEDGMKELGLL